MGKNSFAADIDEAIEGNVEEIEIDQEAILNSLVKQNGFKFYTSEVFYNFHPDAIRPKRFRIVDFVDEIVKTFDIALEHQEAFSKIRQEDDQNIPHLLFHEFENHGLVFRDGVFYREKKPIVRINTIVLQRERLIINVDGSEEPIEIIKNEVANLIEKYNFSKTSEYSFDSFADDFFETNSLYTNVVFDYINSETITEDIYSYGLALYLCTLSAISGIPLKKNIVAVGGFSLTGNIFAISNAVEKALIADNLGYEILLFPKANEIDFLNYYKQSKEALKLKDNLIFCDTLDDAILASFSIRPNYLFPFN